MTDSMWLQIGGRGSLRRRSQWVADATAQVTSGPRNTPKVIKAHRVIFPAQHSPKNSVEGYVGKAYHGIYGLG
jgi:hypothetical protein